MPEPRSNISVVIVCIIVAAAVGVGWYWMQPTPPQNTTPSSNADSTIEEAGSSPPEQHNAATPEVEHFTPAQFKVAIEAVAATEEADFERARRLWSELIAVFPKDTDIIINQAVSVLKWIDTIENSLQNDQGKLAPERREELIQEVESAYSYSEQVTDELSTLQGFDYRVPLIRAAIVNSKAGRLSYPDDIALRKQAAEILSEALQRQPNQPLLAASFDNTLLTLGGVDEQLEAQKGEFLYEGWKASPRNLYLLRQTAEAFLQGQDPRLLRLMQPSIDMTRPMWSMVQSSIDKVQPDKLAEELEQAIATSGDWNSFRTRLYYWLNVIKAMPSFHSDSKRVIPDPLVLLDTTFLQRLAPTSTGTSAPLSPPAEYQRIAADEVATVAVWYDTDFDLHYDVVAAHGNQLQFLDFDGTSLQTSSMLEVSIDIQGILPIDLFEVQSPSAPRLPASVAELMIENSSATRAAAVAIESQPAGPELYGSRNSSLQELLVWGPTGMRVITADSQLPIRFHELNEPTGLESLGDVQSVAAADIESDGDLDLLLISPAGLHLMQNNGNRSFSDITRFSSLPPDLSVKQAIACDYDRDMDQDFMLVTNAGIAVLENLLHSQFRVVSDISWQQIPEAASMAFGDFDNNSSWDFVVTGPQGSSRTLTRTTAPGSFSILRTESLTSIADELAIDDVNNDGILDLIFASTSGISLQLGTAAGEFQSPSALDESAAKGLTTMDANYDGNVELLALSNGKPTIWATSASQGNFVDVRLAGINDINGGGRVNHYCLGSTLEIWRNNDLLSRPVQVPVTHFGLGNANPENLRIIFPHGLTQNVENIGTNVLAEEMQLLRGSCPYVYGWDGQQFQLITDLLWNAPLGLQVSRGQTLPDRRWEYLLLPGDLVRERDGHVELRVTEELWEIAYFDQVELTAIDHPADAQVFTNEKVGPASIAEPTLFTASETVDLEIAVDSHGRDVTQQLAKRDRQYAQAFVHQVCQGLTEPHYIEMDFGTLPVDQPLRLFLTGWMYPTDTSLNIGIDQNPERHPPEAPSLWVVDENEQWVCALPYMGFPGGKPKSIVVDLANVFRSGDHRIRIAASQQIYWDEAFVSWDSDTTLLHPQPLSLESAELHYRGFSEFLPRQSDQPHWFDYQRVTTAVKWPELAGPFTRYGDVLNLLAEDDDQLVVMSSGDEIKLSFVGPISPVRPGWRRDYVMHNVGWDKDADANTIAGQGSLPLPFKNQASYPPPLEQLEEAARALRKNAETLSRYGNSVRPFSLLQTQ
ncbi:MAG: CRTAC1 family protein [Planctomycetales bacterium]|nr:CRTAC1 family protein [Planctomycetales bacterium]